MLEGSDEGGWKVVDMMVCGDGGGPLGVKEMMIKGYEVVEVVIINECGRKVNY